MAISPEYREFVLEQLEPLGPISAKSMFGGVGLYREGTFFGLLYQDTLYLKVDDATRPEFEAAGMGPFKPYEKRASALQYYEVPADVLEDRERLAEWATKAVAAARRAKAKSPARARKPARPAAR